MSTLEQTTGGNLSLVITLPFYDIFVSFALGGEWWRVFALLPMRKMDLEADWPKTCSMYFGLNVIMPMNPLTITRPMRIIIT